MHRILLSWLALLVATAALAQAPVQQSPTRLDACTNVGLAAPAVSLQATLQVTPPAGQYVYICGFAFDVCANATGSTAQNNVTFTSTNINGSPTWQYSAPVLTSLCYASPIREMLPTPLKSAAPGTQVQIQSPALDTNLQYTIRMYYYFAP
jgi:hypothetical protein